MIENKNVYKVSEDSSNHPDGDVEMEPHVQGGQPATSDELPVLTRKALIDFILKYECSASSEQKKNFDLIDKCIQDGNTFLSYALKLIHHMISNNQEIISL